MKSKKMDDWLVKLNMYVQFTQSDLSPRPPKGLLESRHLLQSGSFILLLVARPSPQDSVTLFIAVCTTLLCLLAYFLGALPIRVIL